MTEVISRANRSDTLGDIQVNPPFQGGRDRVSPFLLLLWLAAAAAFSVAVLVVAPGRGAGWSVDDGMFLVNAMSVANGGALELMLPQEPVYLVNALWNKLGARELLHFRYIYYFLNYKRCRFLCRPRQAASSIADDPDLHCCGADDLVFIYFAILLFFYVRRRLLFLRG